MVGGGRFVFDLRDSPATGLSYWIPGELSLPNGLGIDDSLTPIERSGTEPRRGEEQYFSAHLRTLARQALRRQQQEPILDVDAWTQRLAQEAVEYFD